MRARTLKTTALAALAALLCCGPALGDQAPRVGYLFFETADTSRDDGVLGLGICQSVINALTARNDVYMVESGVELGLRPIQGVFDHNLDLSIQGLNRVADWLDADSALLCIASPATDERGFGFRLMILTRPDRRWRQQGSFTFTGRGAEYERLLTLALVRVGETLGLEETTPWPPGGDAPDPNGFRTYSRAVRAFHGDRDQEALALAELLLSTSESFRDLHVLMGALYLNRNFDYERAKHHLGRTLELKDDSRNRQRLGMVDYLFGSTAAALGHFRKAAALNANDPQAFYNLSMVLDDMGNAEAAIEALVKVVELSPSNGAAWYDLACKYSLTGRTTEALAALRTAVSLDGDLFRRMARTDQDLNNIRHEPEYQRTIYAD